MPDQRLHQNVQNSDFLPAFIKFSTDYVRRINLDKVMNTDVLLILKFSHFRPYVYFLRLQFEGSPILWRVKARM